MDRAVVACDGVAVMNPDWPGQLAACGDNHANVPLRMYIALKILRAWNSGTAGFSILIVATVHKWFDDGMTGPIPWPTSPFVAEWADQNGFSKVGQYVGFRCTVKLVRENGDKNH